MTAVGSRPATRTARRATGTGFRPDIEGLRAVAVLLVVLSHAGVGALAGGYVGVDVFFVISGFLITTLLAREVTTTGRISLSRFYARRAVRLLPASTLVLAVSLAASWVWLSPVRVAEHAGDALAAALYSVNIRLATGGTDYFADAAPSPFQHFWSLAVEEQFYLLWPLIIIVVCGLLRRRRAVLAGVLAMITVGSFALSVVALDRAAPWAYFGPHSRAWELGVGALVALGAHRLARWRAPALGWAGLAAVGAAAVVYDAGTPFPGAAALLPVAGAALVVAFPAGVTRLLSPAPVQFVGRLSYGWYLWHWPVLVIAPAALGVTAGPWFNLLLCAVALGLAWLTFHLVENPVRHRRPLIARPARGLVLGLSLSAAAAVLAVLAAQFPPAVRAGGPATDTARALIAAGDEAAELRRLVVAGQDAAALPDNLTPALGGVAEDRTLPQTDGCHLSFTATVPSSDCVYGRADAAATVVLFGDSHALQWFPAMREIAVRRGWRLVVLTKSSCSPADVTLDVDRLKRRYTECTAWRTGALRRIRQVAPNLVVVASSMAYRGVLAGHPADPDAVWTDGWRRTMSTLRDAAHRVAWIVDTPFLTQSPVDCLTAHTDHIGRCALPRATVLRDPPFRSAVAAEARRVGATVVDPIPWLCAARCPMVLGNALVYRDGNHLSTHLAGLLAPLLGDALG
ncbi:acyltransferase family protein [Mangrovihabitans endophyticus]|uniref:Acyltransferase n=1 Tax=Mangrovihabitans endophyticus TaxID=1751298 RepID=A0A8J3BZY2_9ACTN|nr:acyltransferase family protein [Mangrovihabitans endophyticus]GGK89633.1 acyltransferase [Mangrovihabitans endophyticus]